ncbi:MAG TPA: hypothetical protein VNY06_01975 [Methylocella sp.]|nr:hypothetical protein [Methylocella sp.]
MDQSWIELIELCLKVLAVLGAGVWAFTALRVLTNSDTANASLRNSEASIKELELRAKQQAVVSVDIKPAVQRSMDGDGYVITAVVELANRGAQNTTINWKDQPPAFHVRLAKFDADGKPKYDPPTRFRVPLSLNPRSGAVSHVIRPGATESIPFAFKVASAGLYLLSFRGAIDALERAEAERRGLQVPEAWTGNKYVLVRGES